MVRKNFNWMYAAILSFCGMVSLTSCGDSDEGLVQLQSPEESYGSEFVGNWATDNSDGNKGYEGYGIYADGRFEYYTVAFSEEGNGEMKVDSLSGTWTPLMSIPNKWDSQATEPLKGVEVQFAAQAEDGTQLTDTLIMEKMDDDYTLMWASELNRIAESLASSETATTRGWGSFWSSVKDIYNNVVNTIKKIAYPASNYLTWRINGESQKIVSGYADWMRDIYGDVNPKICEMSIPGTHDSFTYNYSGLVSLVAARGVKTQGLDIAHQWAAGVRSFDVRMNRRGSTLGMYHGPFYLGLSLSQALNEIRNQLKAHPKEMAIVFLQFEECSATDEYCKMDRYLFQFNNCASSLKFFLELFGFFFLYVLFYVLGSSFNHVFGFFQSKAGHFANNLNDTNFLAGFCKAFENNCKFSFFFSCGCARSCNSNCCGSSGHSELFFNSFYKISKFHYGVFGNCIDYFVFS